MITAFAFNPAQLRAPKGTPIGGQWIEMAGGVLSGLEAWNLVDSRTLNAPTPVREIEDYQTLHDFFTGEVVGEEPIYRERGGSDDPYLSIGEDYRPPELIEQSQQAMFAYMTDKTHGQISDGLRSGKIDPVSDSVILPDGSRSYFGVNEVVNVYTDPYGMLPPDVSFSGDGSGLVAAIDESMELNSTKETLTFYRGGSMEDPWLVEPGTTWVDKAYTSTTTELEVAIEFAKLRSGLPSVLGALNETREIDPGAPVVYKIIVPPGTHFIPGAPSIDEFVLERNIQFEVISNDAARGEMTLLATPLGYDEGESA